MVTFEQHVVNYMASNTPPEAYMNCRRRGSWNIETCSLALNEVYLALCATDVQFELAGRKVQSTKLQIAPL